MRHKIAGRKLGLPTDQRMALLRNLVRSLFLRNKIRTTEARAKEARRIAERLITKAKTNDLDARRQVRRVLAMHEKAAHALRRTGTREARSCQTEDLVKKLFDEIVPKIGDRAGGYTRLTRVGARRGDAAPLAVLELVLEE
jgi:large subunit ribosomal protein L17